MPKQKAQEETRSAQVNVSVTPAEKHALRVLAAINETSEGDLLYPFIAQSRFVERVAELRRGMTEAA